MCILLYIMLVIFFLFFVLFFLVFFFFFFFQAEDGIRDGTVTGVQTCALPILLVFRPRVLSAPAGAWRATLGSPCHLHGTCSPPAYRWCSLRRRSGLAASRSEERRVGKECRCRWARDH